MATNTRHHGYSHPIKDSVTAWAFENVTNMRNPSDEENPNHGRIALAKKGGRIILAEVAYLILPLVAIVEVVVRGIFALLAAVVYYCSGNETVQGVAKRALVGAGLSGVIGITSVAALVWNFKKNDGELDSEQMVCKVFPCMKREVADLHQSDAAQDAAQLAAAADADADIN